MSATILIVDDNPHISKLLTMNLEKEGFRVLHATDGEDGYARIQSDRPDLVISDVMMPKMDGITLCQKIRVESVTPMVPFMFLTSIDSDVTLKRGFRTGADQYLIKSEISRDILIGKINEMLKHCRKLEDISKTPKAFKGELSELGLVELLQFLHLQKSGGPLTLVRPSSPEGTVILHQGRAVSATLGNERDEKALHVMSGWKRGSFSFVEIDMSSVKPTIMTSTPELILNSCRPLT